DGDAEAGRTDDREYVSVVSERMQLPNLVVGAGAFGQAGRVTGRRGLVGLRQAVEAKAARGQVDAALVVENLVGLPGAARHHHGRAGLKQGLRNVDTPSGAWRGKRGPEAIIRFLRLGRGGRKTEREGGDRHPDWEAQPRYVPLVDRATKK